jgi:predicted transcriptional regulator
MSAQSLEQEFDQYWQKLSTVEKESLLAVAKNYVELKNDEERISIEQYNKEIDEAMAQMDAGEYLSLEEVVEMSKTWTLGK